MFITRVGLLVCALLLLTACAMQQRPLAQTVQDMEGTALTSSERYRGYQPIDPIPVATVMRFNRDIGEEEQVLWASLDTEERRTLLPNQSAQVSVASTDANAELKYLTASISGAAGSYVVVMDFMKYRVESVYDYTTGDYLGSGRIGVGLRIKADVETKSAAINLGSLLSLGLAAERKQLQGSISVDVIGIDSKEVTDLLPLSANIDQTSIQSSLQALASIKARMWDANSITPQLISFKQAVDKGVNSVKENPLFDPQEALRKRKAPPK